MRRSAKKMDCIKICSMCTNEEDTCGECTESAAQTALEYREMLKQIEWAYKFDGGDMFCPVCKNDIRDDHKKGCKLAELLKEE